MWSHKGCSCEDWLVLAVDEGRLTRDDGTGSRVTQTPGRT